MTQFILYLDPAGAEFTQARANRREVLAAVPGKLLRFKPDKITPMEVVDGKGSAQRAAGGFLLLRPAGAALGVLTGKGPTVVFEMQTSDGAVHRGVIRQTDYPALRLKIEKMRNYKPGDLRRSIARTAEFLLLLSLCVVTSGPAGLLLAPAIWCRGGRLIRYMGRGRAAV